MAEATRVFAFDAFASAAAPGPHIAPGVTIASLHVGAMVNVRGDMRDAAFVRDVSAAFRATLPAVPNTATAGDAVRALWLGPDEWLIVENRENRGQTTFSSLENVVCPPFTDVSHGRAVLRLSGPDVRAALAKGCPLDLDPREFPVDACAQTAIAKINIILDHVEPDVFDLYCPRSYAGSFWNWVTEAAVEYGCNISRPA